MKTIFVLALLVSSQAFAQQNLPNFSDLQKVGRVPVFRSPRGITWFLPTAFQTQLSCSPQAQTRSCIVKVLNSLSAQESEGLAQIQASVGFGSVALTPINPTIVARVEESFSAQLSGLQTSEMKLQTLALNDRGPYASVALRGDAASMAKIEQAYASGGLGTFNSEILLNVESVGEYIAIRNGESLKEMLLRLPVNLSKQQMLDAIQAMLPKLDFHVYNVSVRDAAVAAAIRIRTAYFQYTRFTGYSAVTDAQMPTTLVMRDEHSAPYQVLCTASIPLKANAEGTVDCVEASP